MKKIIAAALLFAFFSAAASSQEEENIIVRMDEAVKTLAGNIHAKLIEKRAEKVFVGQFNYHDGQTTFSSFWVNQLIDELVNINGRNYSVLAQGAAGAEWTISGEIIVAAGIIRVYTRLIKTQDREIEGSFYSGFMRDEHINSMLVSIGNTGSSSGSVRGSGSTVDTYEPDSWERPVTYTIGDSSQSSIVLNRALTEEDEDFFLLIPERNGRLTIETTGSTDTFLQLFNYDEEEELAEDDDGGQGTNARINYNVREGARYLALVKGYSSSAAGPYGFRAYMTVRDGMSSFENPIAYEIRNGEDNAVSARRTLQAGDEDYFLLVPASDGRLTIETTGRLDTYIELYDEDEEIIAENDDGGTGNNARIRHNVRAGKRYVALIRGYSGSVSGNYNFRAFFPGSGLQARDEYEPDDEPGQAKTIEIGTPQERTFHSADDVDWVKFEVTRPGRYIINASGINSNRLDTYLELFDSNINLIAEDDDGGDSLGARISRNLTRGTYYIKVRCIDEEPDQGYVLLIEAQ